MLHANSEFPQISWINHTVVSHCIFFYGDKLRQIGATMSRGARDESVYSHLSHICAVISLKSMKYKECDNLFRISRVEYGIHE